MSSVEASYDLWKRNGKNTHSPPQKTVIHLIEIHQKNPSTKRCFKFQHPTSIKKANMKDPSSDRTHLFHLPLKTLFPPLIHIHPVDFPTIWDPCVFLATLRVSSRSNSWISVGSWEGYLTISMDVCLVEKYKKNVPSWCKKDPWGFSQKNLRNFGESSNTSIFLGGDRNSAMVFGRGLHLQMERSGDVRKACRYLDFLHQWGIKATPRAIEQADGGTLDP